MPVSSLFTTIYNAPPAQRNFPVALASSLQMRSQVEKIALIILAAGGSARLGRPKQLLQFRGRSLLRRTLDAALRSGCAPIILVTGSRPDRIRAEADRSVIVTKNRQWRHGPGTSIRAGLRQAMRRDPIDAALLCVCDQPFISASLLRGMVRRFRAGGRSIVACRYDNTIGVPALFGRQWFNDLLNLDPDQGAKAIIRRNRRHVAIIPFPKGGFDIDTPADYDRLIEDGD
jgi:molybdenum cofactor cytidylyltransferase